MKKTVKALIYFIVVLIIVLSPLLYHSIGGIFANETISCLALAGCSALVFAFFIKPVGDSIIAINATDLAVAIFFFYGLLNIWIIKHFEVNIFTIYKGAALAACYFVLRLTSRKWIIVYAIVLSGLVQSCVVALQETGYISGNNTIFIHTGSFGNPGPLGGYLAVCLVVTIALLYHVVKNKTKKVWLLLSAALAAQCYALYLSDSRAGIMSFIAGFVVVFSPKIQTYLKSRKTIAILVASTVIITLFAALYSYRPDSAKGRLLIWRVSLDMIADAPIFGQGTDSFVEKYMLYQANYFAKYPESSFASVADNAITPFNEFVNVLVWGGFIAFLFLCAMLYFAFAARRKDETNSIFKAGLLAAVVFSFFSYPSEIFPLLLLYTVLLGAIEGNPVFCFNLRPRYSLTFALSSLCLRSAFALLSLCLVVLATKDIFYLGRLSSETLESIRNPDDKQKLENMNVYHNRMKQNFAFKTSRPVWAKLLSDENMLNEAEYSDKDSPLSLLANSASLECFIPSCESYCLMGKYHFEIGNYHEAKRFFGTAANMIPTRLIPHYRLWELYTKTDEIPAAIETAQKIVNMSVKTNNVYAIRIKGRMKKYLKAIKNYEL